MKFRVGDRVRRNSDSLESLREAGFPDITYTVMSTAETGLFQSILLEHNGYNALFSSDRFHFAEDENTNDAKKEDSSKPRFDFLMSLNGLHHICNVFSHGEKKYGDPYNFRNSNGDKQYKRRLLAAALRHLYAYLKGEVNDKESGLPHISHAISNLLMVLDLDEAK